MAESQGKRTDYPGVAVVTGAASGLGAAIAQAFVEAGCRNLALIDVNATGLSTVRETLLAIRSDYPSPLHITTHPCDVTSPPSVSSTFAQIKTDHSKIDYAVNCAGVLGPGKPTTKTTLEQFDLVNNINYRGVFLCSREELSLMQQNPLSDDTSTAAPGYPPSSRVQRGAIVNIASSLAFSGMPSSPVYCASKAAVASLTRCDALDYAADRIRINCVAPGLVATPMTLTDPDFRAMLEANVVQMTPVKRMGRADEIADAVLFLCSTKASFCHGVALIVDGGLSIV